ncbi:Aste57867_968 [Aphanomyces stellatus]|uniref:Aste57867_968 protein n=1 Tax=Aphanomyces stellatus TaxID=120398 RepID=A0A485K4C2_9STRA|nr:hypothetical protein As57867_000967 [Aphanomyces stellatus]VFT78190.1 Aste57867_968 [Aphanomyces stellatus]
MKAAAVTHGEDVGSGAGSSICSSPVSFLGVANAECIGAHLGYAAFLCAIIVFISVVMEVFIEYVRRVIRCPQMMRVVNRFFEELMVMGVISMVCLSIFVLSSNTLQCIFAINTSGVTNQLSFVVSGLSTMQLLHFQEFFHYVVFMTAVYYICIMVLLIVIATVVPRFLYDRQQKRNQDDGDGAPTSPLGIDILDASAISSVTGTGRLSTRRNQRQVSGYDFVNGSRMYYLLRTRYKREGWSFRFNLVKQFALWKSFEVLAYNVCQYRSGYLYKNPSEMQRIFGLSYRSSHHVDFARFNTLCTRNMLATVTKLHYSAFTVLVLLVMVSGLLPHASPYFYLGLAAALCLMNVVIMIKTLRILKGIIKDRLRIFTLEDIERMLPVTSTALWSPPRKRRVPRLKVVAQLVRAIVRMQMSVLCHRQLHYHDSRFWFRSPHFLLRLFQFATTGQALYLVWLTLVIAQALYLVWLTLVIAQDKAVQPWMYILMALFPLVSMFIVTPLTMPSLVLVMSLTGFFVEQNPAHGTHHHGKHHHNDDLLSTKDRIRVARRSYLRSTDDGGMSDYTTSVVPPASPRMPIPFAPLSPLTQTTAVLGGQANALTTTTASSSKDMFLHMYDLPLTTHGGAPPLSPHHRHSSVPILSPVMHHHGTPKGTAYHRLDKDDESPPAPAQPTETKRLFENYCSSYGGYPSQNDTDGSSQPSQRK